MQMAKLYMKLISSRTPCHLQWFVVVRDQQKECAGIEYADSSSPHIVPLDVYVGYAHSQAVKTDVEAHEALPQ